MKGKEKEGKERKGKERKERSDEEVESDNRIEIKGMDERRQRRAWRPWLSGASPIQQIQKCT
eukprot:1154475-Pelagomonas_calceolata.AAC.5